ncbi:MFS transporter [Sediminibacterium sp.]|uniref:MFS transporter n=1 Tax=Sediminibacterium sp. TaxID=1917865 RepID=UPI002733DF7B|nr:MFS transporter [Sediminibacterium sp.]MDP3566402.1 MFS transporter [Sediminibacterium sp.]
MIKDTRSFALILAFLASFLTPFVGSSINIALPQISQELSINAIIMGWIPTAYLLVLAVLLIPVGRFSDIHGRKKIFWMGIIIFTISSFLAGFSTSGEMLLFFRIIQGIGSAMIFANVNAMVASVFPVMERGRALGIAVTGAYLGLFLGPVLGGILTESLGWRSIFFFNVPLGVITTYAASKLKEEWRPAKGENFDIIGTFILGISMVLVILGLTQLPQMNGAFILSAGLISGLIYYFYQNKIETPVFDLRIFKNRTFGFNSLATLISYTASYPLIFLLSLYLQYALKLNPATAGIVLAVQPLFITIFSSYAGRLSDRKDPYKLAMVGMTIVTITTFVLAFINSHIWEILILLSLMGIGFALFGTPNNNIVFSSVKKKYFGVAGASLSTMRVVGQLMGMAFSLLLLNIFIGGTFIGPENISLFILCTQISLVLFSIMCFFGILATWRGREQSI